MLYAGLDLSRKRLDVHLLEESGATKEGTAVSPHGDALRTLVASTAKYGEPVRAAIESMNGARFVHDTLELAGWDVDIADAQKVKGLAPLACKTDRIDAWVLAELARRDLVPAIWLPTPGVRAERERARSACTWCDTARHSRTGSTPRSSPSATPARSPTCSERPGMTSWRAWRSPNHGPRRCRRPWP